MSTDKYAFAVGPTASLTRTLAGWLRIDGDVRVREHAELKPALDELSQLQAGLLVAHADCALRRARGLVLVREFAAGRTQAHRLWALTHRSSEPEELTLLRAGFDEVSVLASLSPQLFRARAMAQLRHVGTCPRDVVEFGPAMLLKRARLLLVSGRTIQLSAGDYSIAYALLTRPAEGFSADELRAAVEADGHGPLSRGACRIRVSRLRKSLGKDAWLVNGMAGTYSLGLPPRARPDQRGAAKNQ